MKVKPCPFCGTQPVIKYPKYYGDETIVYCKNPDCIEVTVKGRTAEVMRLWNVRAPQPPEVSAYWKPRFQRRYYVCSYCNMESEKQFSRCPYCDAKMLNELIKF